MIQVMSITGQFRGQGWPPAERWYVQTVLRQVISEHWRLLTQALGAWRGVSASARRPWRVTKVISLGSPEP